jgi:trimeric autotransporter adhesin
MKTRMLQTLIAIAMLAGLHQAAAQGTAFTYQGRLQAGGQPANGLYDFTFQVFDAMSAGNSQGGIVNTNGVGVTNGLFMVILDFGNQFNGAAPWLQISVSTNLANNFFTLAPRQQITPVPYAITAGNVVGLQIQPNTADGAPNVIGGASVNFVAPGAVGATIGGGGASDFSGSFFPNGVAANFDVICGGVDNQIQNGAVSSIIGGGFNNQIQTNADHSTIGGGQGNQVQNSAFQSVIGGGANNQIQPNASYSMIGGGQANQIQATASSSVICGGEGNYIQSSADHSVIGGGNSNQILGEGSFIGGGGYDGNNLIGNTINGNVSTISGGLANSVTSSYGTIPGGDHNAVSAAYSLAAGHRAKANHQGDFVWADSQDTDFASTANNQFLIRALNGVAINKNNPGYALDVNGSVNISGNYLINGIAQNSSQWIKGSSNIYYNNGNVGIGTTTPHAPMEIDSASAATHTSEFLRFGFGPNDYDYVSAFFNGNPGGSSLIFNVEYASGDIRPAMILRGNGGIIFTNNGNTGANQSVSWAPGNGSWSFSSDRNLKDRFEPVNAQSVLHKVSKLPLSEWSYKGYSQRHIGPMAQDFHALFPLNDSDKTLNDLDLHGIALAAIQGLNEKVEAQTAQLQQKDEAIRELDKSVAELKELISKISKKVDAK